MKAAPGCQRPLSQHQGSLALDPQLLGQPSSGSRWTLAPGQRPFVHAVRCPFPPAASLPLASHLEFSSHRCSSLGLIRIPPPLLVSVPLQQPLLWQLIGSCQVSGSWSIKWEQSRLWLLLLRLKTSTKACCWPCFSLTLESPGTDHVQKPVSSTLSLPPVPALNSAGSLGADLTLARSGDHKHSGFSVPSSDPGSLSQDVGLV